MGFDGSADDRINRSYSCRRHQMIAALIWFWIGVVVGAIGGGIGLVMYCSFIPSWEETVGKTYETNNRV